MPHSGGAAIPHGAATLLHMQLLRLDTTMEVSGHSRLLVLPTGPAKARVASAAGGVLC